MFSIPSAEHPLHVFTEMFYDPRITSKAESIFPPAFALELIRVISSQLLEQILVFLDSSIIRHSLVYFWMEKVPGVSTSSPTGLQSSLQIVHCWFRRFVFIYFGLFYAYQRNSITPWVEMCHCKCCYPVTKNAEFTISCVHWDLSTVNWGSLH